MARNRLQERDNNLPNVDYEALLKEILVALKKKADLFQVSASRLQIRVDTIAQDVVSKQGTNFAEVCPFGYTRGLTHITANFLNGEAFNAFRILIERIQEQLARHLK